MRSFTAIAGIAFALVSVVAPAAAETPSGESVSLDGAIEAFNAKAASNAIGKSQPVLTEDEMIAAIRAWEPEKDSPVSDALRRTFKRIAETRKLPANAKLEDFGGQWVPKGDFCHDVWWVRVMIEREDGSTYSFPIRERMIRSRPYTEIYEEEVLESPDGGRYTRTIRRDLEESEELKILPKGPYSVAPDDQKPVPRSPFPEPGSSRFIKTNPPGTLAGNLEVPSGPYAVEPPHGDGAPIQELKTELEALREQLRQLEKRLADLRNERP